MLLSETLSSPLCFRSYFTLKRPFRCTFNGLFLFSLRTREREQRRRRRWRRRATNEAHEHGHDTRQRFIYMCVYYRIRRIAGVGQHDRCAHHSRFVYVCICMCVFLWQATKQLFTRRGAYSLRVIGLRWFFAHTRFVAFYLLPAPRINRFIASFWISTIYIYIFIFTCSAIYVTFFARVLSVYCWILWLSTLVLP